MSVTYGMVISAKLDLLTGVHQPGDVYMVALYGNDAELNQFTTVYTPVGEVKGKGYIAGGKRLAGYEASIEGTRAELSWDGLRWPNASIRARSALVYNKSKGNRAITILDLGEESFSTNGNWDLVLPDAVVWIG